MSCGQSCSTKESRYRIRRPALEGENGQSWSRYPLSLFCGEHQWPTVFSHRPLGLPPTAIACFLLYWWLFYLYDKRHDQGNLLNKEIIWGPGFQRDKSPSPSRPRSMVAKVAETVESSQTEPKAGNKGANREEHLTSETLSPVTLFFLSLVRQGH